MVIPAAAAWPRSDSQEVQVLIQLSSENRLWQDGSSRTRVLAMTLSIYPHCAIAAGLPG
jgi:hypothetical protein